MASSVAPQNDPLFDSAWLKWGQGVLHAQTLEADVDVWRTHTHADPVLGSAAEYHAERHGFGVYATDVAPMPVRWGLLIGDIANAFRCSLDHLAWALVIRGKTPPCNLTRRQRKAVFFPILGTRTEFNGQLPVKLPGVRRADIARVRRHQPYHVGQRNRRRHPLAMLAVLVARDKHRTIQPVWIQPTRVDIEITNLVDCIVADAPWKRYENALDVGAELAFIRARKIGPEPHVQVQTRVTAEPSLEERIAVREWIAQCAIRISVLLSAFSEPPPALAQLGVPFDP